MRPPEMPEFSFPPRALFRFSVRAVLINPFTFGIDCRRVPGGFFWTKSREGPILEAFTNSLLLERPNACLMVTMTAFRPSAAQGAARAKLQGTEATTKLEQAIRQAASQYFRLVILAGAPASGKTAAHEHRVDLQILLQKLAVLLQPRFGFFHAWHLRLHNIPETRCMVRFN